MSIFSFLVIKQAKYHYSNNPSRDQGSWREKLDHRGIFALNLESGIRLSWRFGGGVMNFPKKN